MLRGRKGQNTLEYVIVLTAIVAAIIVAAGKMKTKVESSLEHVTQEMEDQAKKIKF